MGQSVCSPTLNFFSELWDKELPPLAPAARAEASAIAPSEGPVSRLGKCAVHPSHAAPRVNVQSGLKAKQEEGGAAGC